MVAAPLVGRTDRTTDREQEELQRWLARANTRRLRPGLPGEDWRIELIREHELREREGAYVERERAAVVAAAAEAPRDPAGFIAWFEALRSHGPGQGDPLFPWLAERASWPQLRWFLLQEIAGEAGFDDLVALTQVKLPERAKLELARNYWDEMGRGAAAGMHGRMLDELAEHLQLRPSIEDTVWESLALSNLLIALAANRRYAWHAVGALGVVELTAPTRVGFVDAALAHLGIGPEHRRYFAVHAVLDVKHSQAWNAEVLAPAVAADPAVAPAIAEGALMRLAAGARCFARYRAELGVEEPAWST